MYSKICSIFIIYLMISGCSFTPLYPNIGVNIQLQSINIKKGLDIAQEEEIKQIIYDYFANHHFNDSNGQYYIDLLLEVKDTPALIQKNTITSRFNVKVNAEYNIYNQAHIAIYKDKLELIDSYDIEYNLYANYVTDNQMKLRLIKTMAEELYYNIQLQIKGSEND